MIEILTILLRIAGAGLLLLAALHIPIGRQLKWREDVRRLTPVNAAIFHVHTFFICLILVMMGLPCLLDPGILIEKSRAGAWMAWSISGFWAVRLHFQCFVYQPNLWRGKRLETTIHIWFTIIWAGLTALFGVCGMWQAGWLLSS